MGKRTTLILDEYCYQRTKELALSEGRTVSELVSELLRLGLESRARKATPSQRGLPSYSMGPPAVNIADRDQLEEFLKSS